jgi:hypothetical protein
MGSLHWHTAGEPYTLYQETTPPLQAKEAGPLVKKELITVPIHVVTPLPYDQRGHTGFHHLSAIPSDPGIGTQASAGSGTLHCG